jgi:hypothetical protein
MSDHGRLWSLFAGLLLVVAACGGDSDPAAPTTAEPSATTVAATTQSPADPGTDGGDRSGDLLGRWEVVNYVLPDGGGITNVVGADPVYIEFNADGSISYNTGCNSGGSQFVTSESYYLPKSALDDVPEGQAITLGPDFEQTEIGCDGFLGDQDRDLPDNMAAVTRFILGDDRLLLLDEFMLIDATKSG